LLDITQRVYHQVQQFVPTFRASIAYLPLRLRPDIFFRVKFGCVSRESFQMQAPMVAAKLNDFSIPVDRAALPTSSGLRSKVWELLCPRLTSVPSRRASRLAAPSVAGVLGAQISLSKDVNSCCATGPFISGTEHGALLCGASLPVPSTLYGLSVRRLISFD